VKSRKVCNAICHKCAKLCSKKLETGSRAHSAMCLQCSVRRACDMFYSYDPATSRSKDVTLFCSQRCAAKFGIQRAVEAERGKR